MDARAAQLRTKTWTPKQLARFTDPRPVYPYTPAFYNATQRTYEETVNPVPARVHVLEPPEFHGADNGKGYYAADACQHTVLNDPIDSDKPHPDDEAKAQPGTHLRYVQSKFTIPGVTAAKVERVASGIDRHAVAKQTLRSVHERRELARIEVCEEEVRQSLHRERANKARRIALMRSRYPQGLPNYDSPLNPDSAVYARAAGELSAQDKRAIAAERRRVRTEKLMDQGSQLSAMPITDVRMRPMRHRKLLQDNKRTTGCPAALEDTHVRLFEGGGVGKYTRSILESMGPNERTAKGQRRCQDLRNKATRGRDYNILSGAIITDVPPTEKMEERRPPHPSLHCTLTAAWNQD